MTLQEYKRRTAELAIDRGALADGARFKEPENTAYSHEPVFLDGGASLRLPAFPTEDLTYLNPPGSRNYARAAAVSQRAVHQRKREAARPTSWERRLH